MTIELRSLPGNAQEMRNVLADTSIDEIRAHTLTEIRTETGDDGIVRAGGLAVVFDSPSVDMWGWFEVVKRGAFRKLLGTKPDVRLLVNHDGLPLARTINATLTLREVPAGLEWEAEFAKTQHAADVAVLLERGDLSQMSFRFRIAKGGAVWFEDVDDDHRDRREIVEVGELPEISIVTFPAYPATTAGLRNNDSARRAAPEQLEDPARREPVGNEDRTEPDTPNANEGADAEQAAAANRRLDEARHAIAAARIRTID